MLQRREDVFMNCAKNAAVYIPQTLPYLLPDMTQVVGWSPAHPRSSSLKDEATVFLV